MRSLIVIGMMVLGNLGATSFATDLNSNTNMGGHAPECSQQVDAQGKTPTGCFDLTDEQAQAMNLNETSATSDRGCSLRCGLFDFWHHCHHWNVICW